MPRRIDVELTSSRPDGTWTWRAAGARQPKGDLDGSLLFSGAKVGDVIRAEADFDIEGITITAVQTPRGSRKEPERLEIVHVPLREDQMVTSTLAARSRRDEGGPRRAREDRDGRPRTGRDGRGGPGERSPRRGGAGARRPADGRDEGQTTSAPRRQGPARIPRSERPERPAREARPKDARPKAPRLKPGRAHRNEVLDALPPEHRPVAEMVLKGGIPAVRQAIETQNAEARAAGSPEMNATAMLAIAEELLPGLRTAEWHDRAEAALAAMVDVDLKDLRSVVVAADAAARDDVTRDLAEKLREALAHRVETEHSTWLGEIAKTLDEGRTVRALHLSSRPPKAGAPFPPELAGRLTEATNAALTPETSPERYATVLDALAYSPIRRAVVPQGIPAEPGDVLVAAVRKLAGRVPEIALQFGIEAAPTRSARAPRSPAGVHKQVPGPPRRALGVPAPIPPPPVIDTDATVPEPGDEIVDRPGGER